MRFATSLASLQEPDLDFFSKADPDCCLHAAALTSDMNAFCEIVGPDLGGMLNCSLHVVYQVRSGWQ